MGKMSSLLSPSGRPKFRSRQTETSEVREVLQDDGGVRKLGPRGCGVSDLHSSTSHSCSKLRLTLSFKENGSVYDKGELKYINRSINCLPLTTPKRID